jgi:hypothetical protein
MSQCLLKLAFIAITLSLISTDAFAQRGGRGAQGSNRGAGAEMENNQQQEGQLGGRGGGRMQGGMQAEGTQGNSAMGQMGQGRGGRQAGGQSAAGGPVGRFGAGANGSTNLLFAALDTDGDGMISRSEMENAMLAFARLDENKDGKLSQEEAGVTSGGRMGGRGGAGRTAGGQAGGGGQGRAGGGQAGGRGGQGLMQGQDKDGKSK